MGSWHEPDRTQSVWRTRCQTICSSTSHRCRSRGSVAIAAGRMHRASLSQASLCAVTARRKPYSSRRPVRCRSWQLARCLQAIARIRFVETVRVRQLTANRLEISLRDLRAWDALGPPHLHDLIPVVKCHDWPVAVGLKLIYQFCLHDVVGTSIVPAAHVFFARIFSWESSFCASRLPTPIVACEPPFEKILIWIAIRLSHMSESSPSTEGRSAERN
jgi:hypothetical protein